MFVLTMEALNLTLAFKRCGLHIFYDNNDGELNLVEEKSIVVA